ncbi:efflux transporter outer membrane subunit [Aquabacterium sp.]|uniref:efflux transporter outer membrane subunit n=1 Tax=Aquabacterium sp. TaxID=1872578 RepID=UPI0037840C86
MKRQITTIALAASAALLGACAVPGPAPKDPPALEQPAGGAVTVAPDWWKRFGDARIDALVDEALAHNRDLARAMARIDESRALLRGALAERWPAVSASLAGTRARVTENGSVPLGGASPLGNDFRAALNVSYEVDLWGRVASSSAAARDELLAGEFARDTLRTALAAQVVQGYATLQGLDAQIRIYQEVLKWQRESLRLQGLRMKAGELAELDWVQLEAELLNSELQLPKLERARGEAERALALLLGRSPKALVEQGVERADAPNGGAQALPSGLPSDLLLRRPDVQAAEARLRAAGARVDAARAAYFPSITLSAGLGQESSQLSRLFDGPSLIWNVAAALAQPIWNAGRIDAQVEATRARQAQIELDYRDAVTAAFKEARDALAAHGEAQASLTSSRKRAEALTRAADLTRLRFQGGESSRLQLIDAERLALLAQLQAADAQRAVVAAQAELFRALGGGWQKPGLATAAR